ncbi:MAG: hypothetical protein ACK4N5_19270, partial [Myxococcales bacterium]
AALLPVLDDRDRLSVPWLAANFCEESRREEAEALFSPRADQVTGWPRAVAGALEAVDLCRARAESLRPQLPRLLAPPPPAPTPGKRRR